MTHSDYFTRQVGFGLEIGLHEWHESGLTLLSSTLQTVHTSRPTCCMSEIRDLNLSVRILSMILIFQNNNVRQGMLIATKPQHRLYNNNCVAGVSGDDANVFNVERLF